MAVVIVSPTPDGTIVLEYASVPVSGIHGNRSSQILGNVALPVIIFTPASDLAKLVDGAHMNFTGRAPRIYGDTARTMDRYVVLVVTIFAPAPETRILSDGAGVIGASHQCYRMIFAPKGWGLR